MKLFLLFLVFVFSSFWNSVFAKEFTLNADYYYFQSHTDESLTSEQISILNKYHFVFIAGFLNEGARKRYFKDNVNSLKKNNIENVSILFPSSKKSIATNLEFVRAELLRVYEEGRNKPLIIFGHSKGGIEALSLVLQEPQLLEAQVARIITMQSPLSGNEFLDHWIKPSSIHFSSLDGMNSLRGDQVYNVVHQKYFHLNESQKKLVSSRVYFISTSRKPSEVSFLFRLPAYLMMHELKEPSDGIVATKNMTMDLFGQTLGHVKADHTELVISHVPGLNISSEEKTRAFTLAVILNILKELTAQ